MQDEEPPYAVRIFDKRKEGRPLYVIARDFYYCMDRTGQVIRVPAGFVTDFASIPKPVDAFLQPDGPYAQAAIVHDYVYAVGALGEKALGDQALRAAMIDYNVPSGRVAAVYGAVHHFGRRGYALRGDWLFYNPQTLQPAKAPKKPRTAVFATLPEGNCKSFRENTRRWRSRGWLDGSITVVENPR